MLYTRVPPSDTPGARMLPPYTCGVSCGNTRSAARRLHLEGVSAKPKYLVCQIGEEMSDYTGVDSRTRVVHYPGPMFL